MAKAARDTSLKVLPDIESKVRPRAKQLNLKVSTYVGLLIWNYSQSPGDLEVEANSNLARVNLPCNFGKSVAPLLAQIARDTGISENAAAEALIARDLRTNSLTLTILPARGSRKISLS